MTPSPVKAPPVVLLAAFSAMAPLSIDMYLAAWPSLGPVFRCTTSEIQLSLSSFLAGFSLGQLVYGPLSDSWGRRPVVMLGALIYTVASLLLLSTDDLDVFIGLRLVQGIGACAGPVMARAIVRDCHQRDAAARAFSLLMVVTMLVPLIAPSIGAQLLIGLGWRSIFWTLAAMGVLVAVLALSVLRETLAPEHRRPLSLATTFAGYGHVLQDRRFLGFALTGSFMMSGLFVYLSSASHVLLEVMRVPPDQFGFYFGANILGQAGMAYLNSRLVRRMGAERMLRFGLASAVSAGTVMLVAAGMGNAWYSGVGLPLAWFLASLPLIAGNALACALSGFPSLAGTASAVAGSLQFALAASLGAVVGHWRDGTARPMAAMMLLCAVGAAASYVALARAPAREAAPSPGE